MKTRSLSLILVISSLMFSSLACGLFSRAGSNESESAISPAPTHDPQPLEYTPTADSSSGPESTAGVELPTLMAVPDTNGDGKIDICEAVPASVWEMVMSRPMVGKPTPFKDPAMGDGCAFDFGKDKTAAYFSYVTFATEKQFNDALASAVKAEPVTTIGDSAFLNYGPDARQLWVRSGGKAVMVAIGDQENAGGMVLVAPYLLQALQ
jgi:hypothetical protein